MANFLHVTAPTAQKVSIRVTELACIFSRWHAHRKFASTNRTMHTVQIADGTLMAHLGRRAWRPSSPVRCVAGALCRGTGRWSRTPCRSRSQCCVSCTECRVVARASCYTATVGKRPAIVAGWGAHTQVMLGKAAI